MSQLVTTIEPKGIFAWSMEIKDKHIDTTSFPEYRCQMFEAAALDEPEDQTKGFVDFIFPVLVDRCKEWNPFEQDLISTLWAIFKPGCYILAGRKMNKLTRADLKAIKVSVLGSSKLKNVKPMPYDLYACLLSANKEDNTFRKCCLIDRLDDAERIKGHVYTNRCPTNPMDKIQWHSLPVIAKNNRSDHSMTRYDQLALLHRKYRPDLDHLPKSIPIDREACHYILAKDSFAFVVDNSNRKESTDLENTITNSRPYVHLMRPGEYLSGVGMSRYANLTQSTVSYLTRHVNLARLTSLPVVILQEGIKAFQVDYHEPEALDLTYLDTIPASQLIYLDLTQLWTDFKLDSEARPDKGHILAAYELRDVLKSIPANQFNYDPIAAAKLDLVDLDGGNNLEVNDVVFTLEQVIYNTLDSKSGQLEIYWNVYFRVADQHVSLTNKNHPNRTESSVYYLYMKTFVVNLLWSQSKEGKVDEKSNCQATLATLNVSERDLAKVGWSRRDFDLNLRAYIWRLYPFQESAKSTLLEATKKIDRAEAFEHGTFWAERLVDHLDYFRGRKSE